MMKSILPNTIRRRQTLCTIIFAFLIFAFQLSFACYKKQQTNPDIVASFISENEIPLQLTDFNPNELDENAWKELGFSAKQIHTILKYKEIVGGEFESKEQFKKCYAISDEKYKVLEPYLKLPESSKKSFTTHYSKKSLTIDKRFNPDHFNVNDWQKLGFSDKQSAAILKYKDYLGGSFVSKEKFKECFIINEENYQKLEPYLILAEKTPAHFSQNQFKTKDRLRIQYQKFNPNDLDLNAWIALGFSEKQAQGILNYKSKKLRGNFTSLDDIKNCFFISEQKFNEMKSFIVLPKVENTNNSANIQEETDFSKVDLNQISFKQMKEFGFDDKSAAMMLGFRKKLGGFVQKQQILDTYDIDKTLAEKLVNTCFLDTSKVQKYTLVNAPEEWLKNHPYFKYSADKIIFYRITYPDDSKIWKYLKTKPEYEARMKLYLK